MNDHQLLDFLESKKEAFTESLKELEFLEELLFETKMEIRDALERLDSIASKNRKMRLKLMDKEGLKTS